ncbi:MAG: hypothetical protein HYU53_12475 [Acidobacteria bacterium]|nr:hypothetical protein [Acidobacteriota bacterium]
MTASEDARGLAGLVTQFAVVGSNCPNGDLQNMRAVERAATMPGKAALHALPNTPGVEQLADALSNLFQIERSYEMPVPSESVPANVIWLRLGTGAEWNTELFARQAKTAS